MSEFLGKSEISFSHFQEKKAVYCILDLWKILPGASKNMSSFLRAQKGTLGKAQLRAASLSPQSGVYLWLSLAYFSVPRVKANEVS